jgi:hypothetical protein
MKPILCSVQRKLRAILSMSNNAERGTALRTLAQELGCSLGSIYELQTGKLLEEEVVRRMQDAAREERDSRLWWVAFISAAAAVVSALTALIAVIHAKLIP